MENNEKKNGASYKVLAQAFAILGILEIVGTLIYIPTTKHPSIPTLLSLCLTSIIFGILAIVMASKEGPAAKRHKVEGIIVIIIGILIPIWLFTLALSVLPDAIKKASSDDSASKPKVTEKASKDDEDDDFDSISTAEPKYNDDEYSSSDDSDTKSRVIYGADDLAGLTYEDIYNEYVPQIDQETEDSKNEYYVMSNGMSDDDKYDLEDRLANNITNITEEGTDKMNQLADMNSDTSDNCYNWSEKLIDYSTNKVSEFHNAAAEVDQ